MIDTALPLLAGVSFLTAWLSLDFSGFQQGADFQGISMP